MWKDNRFSKKQTARIASGKKHRKDYLFTIKKTRRSKQLAKTP